MHHFKSFQPDLSRSHGWVDQLCVGLTAFLQMQGESALFDITLHAPHLQPWDFPAGVET